MKKVLSGLLALMLLLSLSTTALAADKGNKSHKKEGPSPSVEARPAISAEEACAIALEHAGAGADDAADLTCKLDKSTYRIEFTVGQTAYKYKIALGDGSVIKEESAVMREVPEGEVRIPKSQAEETALANAGVTRGSTKYITSYKVYSSGVPYGYHVSFGVYDPQVRHTTVYTCVIDLYTGEILSSFTNVY